MRNVIATLSLMLTAALLGGCAAGGMTGGSMLPNASQTVVHSQDVVGGGPVPADVLGGGPVPGDVVGGGPVPANKRAHSLDVVGGGPVPNDVVGGGPVPAHKIAHRPG